MSAPKPLPAIKPCPFCGCDMDHDDLTHRGYECACGAAVRVHPSPYARIKGAWGPTAAGRRRAIKAWNRRAPT